VKLLHSFLDRENTLTIRKKVLYNKV
jgi:hypothetical protein